MPTYEQLYAFLKSFYLHSRFEGRNEKIWGEDYSKVVAQSAYERLEKYGIGYISKYESRTATVVKYDRELNHLNKDEPQGEIQARSARLTSIYGSGANF